MLIKKILIFLFLFCFLFAAGFYITKENKNKINAPKFEGIMAINPTDYQNLIAPNSAALKGLLKKIHSLPEAYYFVRDFIEYFPMVPDADVEYTVTNKVGSCIGKAVLLVSLYRALGVKADDLRIVTGVIRINNELIDHAWVEVRINNVWYQQDTTNLLGKFEFNQFPNRLYSKIYCTKENFCFNETGFAVISQLNLMK